MTWCKCHLNLEVVSKDAEATFEREIDLPFIPFEGLRIVLNDEHSDWFEVGSIIEWICERQEFEVFSADAGLETGCGCRPEDECCVLDVDWYIELGWSLVGEVRRGYDRIHHHERMFEPEKWVGTRSKLEERATGEVAELFAQF